MGGKLTIVMYHYVRDLRRSPFPEIKGLGINQFRQQLAYIKRHYTVVSGEDVLDACEGEGNLPPRAAMLSFDDGYIDHFTEVFPLLDAEGLPGCFFPPSECIEEDRVLDVNKIHFTLASVANKSSVVDAICGKINELRGEYAIDSADHYWKRLAVASRWDPPEVVFIKRLLQRELPEPPRKLILDFLFGKYVTEDERAFARELYMDTDQLRYLVRNGMYVGSHGASHRWLNHLSREEQEKEIDASVAFLRRLCVPTHRWIMCYPYGGYDHSLHGVLRERQCTVGLSTKVGIADLCNGDRLALPRLDTNDLPKQADAAANRWTAEVVEEA